MEESDSRLDPAALAAFRDDMLRFATLQLRDCAAAEDAVQEALASALAASENYAGRARLKTWVFAILRNKIIDVLRERARHPTLRIDDAGANDAGADESFDRRGFWRRDERPSDWGQPESDLEDEQFWRVFETCLTYLPENIARIFTMREMLGLETSEICAELSISESNCRVILHRARMRLRRCLEKEWFEGEKRP